MANKFNAINATTSTEWNGRKDNIKCEKNPGPLNAFNSRASISIFLNHFQKLSNRELSGNVLDALRTRYNGRNALQQSEYEIAQHSMDLMRSNIQHLFDEEIQPIIKRYIETYFEPALKNVKDNLKSSGITETYVSLEKNPFFFVQHIKYIFVFV